MTSLVPPPLDPEIAAALAASGGRSPSLTAAGIPLRRKENAQLRPTDEELTRGGRFTVEDRESLLILRPAFTEPAGGIFYLHGGGMVVGDNRSGIAEMLDWATEFGLVIVSVDYRLAPEHRYPAAIEDCYAGLEWTATHATELGFDPARLIIAGGSAGGGLTAALALLARDRGGPAVLGQALICPMIDDRNDTVSARQMTGVDVWDSEANEMAWTALLGAARGGPDVSPYAAPARATDLTGLPPAFIDVGSVETFRDEDVAYATAIWQAGGSAELHVWPGGFHSFDTFAPQAALSRDAKAARIAWLRRLLS
jgi:acetyl esterase/lipase